MPHPFEMISLCFAWHFGWFIRRWSFVFNQLYWLVRFLVRVGVVFVAPFFFLGSTFWQLSFTFGILWDALDASFLYILFYFTYQFFFGWFILFLIAFQNSVGPLGQVQFRISWSGKLWVFPCIIFGSSSIFFEYFWYTVFATLFWHPLYIY